MAWLASEDVLVVEAPGTSAEGVQSQDSNQLMHLIQSGWVWRGRGRYWNLQSERLFFKGLEGGLVLACSWCSKSKASRMLKASIVHNGGNALTY